MFNQMWKENYLKSGEANRKHDLTTVKRLAAEAEREFLMDGYVQALPLFPWIEKEWLEKGIAMGAIIAKNGQYYPLVKETETEVTTGYRGRVPIVEKKKVIDASAFSLFLYQYKEYRKKKYVLNSI